MLQSITETERKYRERPLDEYYWAGNASSDADGAVASSDEPVSTLEERKLGTVPVLPMFLRYSLISLLGVLAQICMVVLEGVVVGNGIGAHGLACMSVVMTFEIINLSFGSSFGAGVSTVCGNLLGAGDEAGARRAFGQGFWLTFLTASVVGGFILIFAPSIVSHIGATPDIFNDCVVAVRIFMLGYPFCITGQMLCQMLRQDEHPALASAIQTFGSAAAATWLVVSVFVLKLGVAGAAAYYAISTALWFLAIFPFLKKGGIFHIQFSDIRVSACIAWRIVRYGCPIFLVQISSAVYVMFMNGSLAASGNTENVASFAIINSYFMYTLNIVCMAFAYALQPIAAYNCGACHFKRLGQLMMWAIVVEVMVIGAISLGTNAIAPQACLVFTGGDSELASMSAMHARIVLMLCAFGFTGQIMSAYFESVGSTWRAVLFGVLRYTVFAVPIIVVFESFLGMGGVWWALPIADALTFVIAMFWAVHELRKLGKLEE